MGGLDVLSGFSTKEKVIGAGVASGVVLGTGILIVSGARKKSVKRRKTTTTKRTTKKTTKRKSAIPRSKAKRWYGKTRSKKIKMTKKGQPYVILANGRARFIKKSRASSMRKRKGGYR